MKGPFSRKTSIYFGGTQKMAVISQCVRKMGSNRALSLKQTYLGKWYPVGL